MLHRGALSFANVIIKFGDDRYLIDFLEEVVLPAFTDTSLKRTYGDDTEYFFEEVRPMILSRDPPTLAIVGRFIKNTVLHRDQVYVDGTGVVPDPATLESAPSSFFTFIINNHKICFFGETAAAPDQSAFGPTLRAFVKRKYEEFIDRLYDDARRVRQVER